MVTLILPHLRRAGRAHPGRRYSTWPMNFDWPWWLVPIGFGGALLWLSLRAHQVGDGTWKQALVALAVLVPIELAITAARHT